MDMKYRKRSLIIEASRFFYDEFGTYLPVDIRSKVSISDTTGKFVIGNNDNVVLDGDYIVEGITGELYPCNPEIFIVIYEIA